MKCLRDRRAIRDKITGGPIPPWMLGALLLAAGCPLARGEDANQAPPAVIASQNVVVGQGRVFSFPHGTMAWTSNKNVLANEEGRLLVLVSGKSVGTASLSYYHTDPDDASRNGIAVMTVYVTQDLARVQAILDSFNDPEHGTNVAAKLLGNGEFVRLEGPATEANHSAILFLLPNNELRRQRIVDRIDSAR